MTGQTASGSRIGQRFSASSQLLQSSAEMMKSRNMKWVAMSRSWEEKGDEILDGKPEGKRLFGKPRRSTWEYNIKINLREIWYQGVAWIHVAENRSRWSALVKHDNARSVPYKPDRLLHGSRLQNQWQQRRDYHNVEDWRRKLCKKEKEMQQE
jgi:hypothetical protein